MTDATAGLSEVRGHHAHIYYEAAQLLLAEKPGKTLAADFPVVLGRFSGEPVGPHPGLAVPRRSSSRTPSRSVVPWLMLDREGLDVLVHRTTDDMVDDRTVYAF